MQRVGSYNAWTRLAPWAGIVFAVLFVAGFLIHGVTPDNDDTAKWQSYWDDSGNRTQAIVGMYLMVASVFAFLWFSRSLLVRLASQDEGSQPLASIAQAASTLFAGAVLVAVVTATSIAGSVEFGDAPVPESADLSIQLDQLAFGILLIPGCLSAAVFIAIGSELARRTGALPKWLVWAGYVAAVVLLASFLFIPLVLIPIWALVTSVVLLLRDRNKTAGAVPAMPA